MTAEELHQGLAQFCGTEGYHRWSMLFRKHVLTDGVKWLCDNANCYWLADAIASYHGKCMKDPMLQSMQFWTLKVDLAKQSAVLVCERDTGNVAFKQKIPYTDFPLAEIKLYVEPGEDVYVILLPEEH